MASLEKRSPTDAVDDAITPDPRDPAHAPATPEQLLDGRRSSSTSGREITEKGSGDVEKNSVGVGSVRGDPEPETGKRSALSQAWKRHRRWITHLTIFLVFTAWWIFGLVFHRSDEKGWLIPTLLYIAILLRLFFYYVPSSLAMRPIRWTWGKTAVPVYDAIPSKMHQPLAAIIAVAVILIGAFVPEETGDNTRANRAVSVFGLIVLLAVLTLTSKDRSAIPWHTVIGGMLTQFIVAVFVLRTQAGFDIFKFISDRARELLGFAGAGMSFLTSPDVLTTGWFLVNVIPAIVFFIALVAMLFHIGFLQWFIGKFATFFFWSLRVSGAEAIVAAATPFIGQGESAMLIRPYVNHLTMSELHQIMVCGFATIAGSVLVFYIGLGLNAQALVSSCIMSIPATLAVSKMRYPEKETPMTAGKLKVPEEEEEKHVNALHAFTDGSWIGLRIAGTIVACVMTVVALVALVNGLLTWWGGYWNISNPNLTLELIMGYLLYPVAWLLGVPGPDVRRVAELIGIKIIVNEFAAFKALTEDAYYMSMAARSRVIATYACCGFGNIGSLGIQIGILSQIAPKRSGDVVRVAVSAFITGVLSTLTSASVAGMLYNESMS